MAKKKKETKKKVGVKTNAELRKTKKEVEETLQDDHSAPANEGWVDLNFKVKDRYRRVFKRVAANHGISMKELLELAFKLWVENFGFKPITDEDDEEIPEA